MDEKRSGMRLTGRGSSPEVDDHLVVPEVTRDEIIAGRKVVAFPAETPHGDKRVELETLLRFHVVPGYVASADLITRFTVDSDFARDTCVRREGVDSATGRRYLVSPAQREEILGCSDVDRLNRWLREATLAATTEDVARD